MNSVANPPNHKLDLHEILMVMGQRAVNSTWFGNGMECFGVNAEEMHDLTDHNRPIPGSDILRITQGIDQTIDGYLSAYDRDLSSHWVTIRAWDGSGFYIETDDPEIKARLISQFEDVEEVKEASHPYEGLFISVPDPVKPLPAPSVQPPPKKGAGTASWDMKAYAEHNRKSTALVSAFFLIDSLEALSKCAQWLSLLESYRLPEMEHAPYFDAVREIFTAGKPVINFDREFKLDWNNQEFQAFLRFHFLDQGRYEMELLLPGVIAGEIADQFKDGREGFCCAFLPPMFYD